MGCLLTGQTVPVAEDNRGPPFAASFTVLIQLRLLLLHVKAGPIRYQTAFRCPSRALSFDSIHNLPWWFQIWECWPSYCRVGLALKEVPDHVFSCAVPVDQHIDWRSGGERFPNANYLIAG